MSLLFGYSLREKKKNVNNVYRNGRRQKWQLSKIKAKIVRGTLKFQAVSLSEIAAVVFSLSRFPIFFSFEKLTTAGANSTSEYFCQHMIDLCSNTCYLFLERNIH